MKIQFFGYQVEKISKKKNPLKNATCERKNGLIPLSV